MRIGMPPRCAKAPTSEGAPLHPPTPLNPTWRPFAQPQTSAWPPNMQELMVELTQIVQTTIREQVRIEVQATMTRMQTTMTRMHTCRSPWGTASEGHNSKSMESTPSEMLRAPVMVWPWPRTDLIETDHFDNPILWLSDNLSRMLWDILQNDNSIATILTFVRYASLHTVAFPIRAYTALGSSWSSISLTRPIFPVTQLRTCPL